MFEPEQTILLSSNLLWSPWLFDGLGASGDLCRDIVMYAGLTKQREVELHLPHFCETMGYDRANLLRPCTPAQVEQIRKTGFDPNYIKAFSNVFGLALVLLGNRTFYFPPQTINKGTPEEREIIRSYKIIDNFDLPSYKVKQGVTTTVKFTLSEELLEENRYEYKTIYPAEYLGLRTAGGEKRTAGHPDHTARRTYLRLLAKRQYWDHLLAEGKASPTSGYDSYLELVEAAGLRRRNAKGVQYDPEKKIAYQLKHLLKRVGALPNISLVPRVLLSTRTGKYEVTWTRLPIEKPSQAEANAPATEAPSLVAAAPAPRRRGRPPGKGKTAPAPKVVTPVPVAKPVVYTQPASQERQKLLADLEDRKKGLTWLRSPDGIELYRKQYGDDPGRYDQALEEAKQLLTAAQTRLTEIGSKMS